MADISCRRRRALMSSSSVIELLDCTASDGSVSLSISSFL
jgi:hypothetical protein